MEAFPLVQPDPAAEVSALYESTARALTYRARTRDEHLRWREALRTRLAEIIAAPRDTKQPRAEVVAQLQADGYTREIVMLHAVAGGVPLHVLRPEGSGPFRPVIALHGHGLDVGVALGSLRNSEGQASREEGRSSFAEDLVRRGFLVFAPEQIGFADRRNAADQALGGATSTCRQAALSLLLLGHTLVGLRVRDIGRVLDYVAGRTDARAGSVGGVGFSGGGSALLYAAALDERLSAVILSGCLGTYRQSIIAIPHCEDNYLPGILRYAEMADIAALVAPRPLFVESGMDDPLFPASSAVAAVTQVRKAYALLGAADRVELEIFAGGHTFHGARSLDWLQRRLQ